LTPNDRYGAYTLIIDHGKEIKHRGDGGSVWGGVDITIEVVGGQDAKTGRGWGFLTPRGGCQGHTLGIAWPSKMCGGGCRGCTWADIDM
jgi:hypothetical protein